MTLFWVVAALLTVAIVALMAWPLLRAKAADNPGGDDLTVYRDQLAELERDRARGLIEADQAASLETEIGRRMLNATRAAAPGLAVAAPARWLTGVVAVSIPVCALLLYFIVGHPGLPGLPLADRETPATADPQKVLAAIEEVKAKLKPVKEDLNRWAMVGQAYAKLGRPRDAIDAFRVAVGIDPNNPLLSAALAETLVAADGGAVGEEAKQRFQAVPADSPARPEARYYLALADSQAGDVKAALKGWQSLLADSPADAGWIDSTRAQIANAAQTLGLDPAKETPDPKPAANARAPSNPDADAIARMTPDQQMEMIRGMVAKLAGRLEANPDDPAGWRQLAKAYEVLGEDDKSKDALNHAAAAAKKAAKP
jgi:cytochrome c-type biogenesis protein CcmH